MELICHKCGAALTPGRGDVYLVRIEAVADPTPPTVSAKALESADFEREIAKLLEQMEDLSEQELMDQVHRRLTLHLCRRCYLAWIDNPTG